MGKIIDFNKEREARKGVKILTGEQYKGWLCNWILHSRDSEERQKFLNKLGIDYVKRMAEKHRENVRARQEKEDGETV